MEKSKKHAHWTSLIDRLEEMPVKEVEVIVIRPIVPPEPRQGTEHVFDRVAYVFGRGSEYFGKLKHQEDCTWYGAD